MFQLLTVSGINSYHWTQVLDVIVILPNTGTDVSERYYAFEIG